MSDSIAYQPTSAVDVVAVFDANFNQLFANARPMKASVKEKAKNMKHPVESGATISDFRIIEQVAIDLHMTLLAQNYVDTYNQIKQSFLSADLLQVQTNTGLYTSMTITGLPHEEEPATFDTIKLTLSLEETIIVVASSSPLPAKFTTKKGGNLSGKQANATQTNAASAAVGNSAAYNSGYFRP